MTPVLAFTHVRKTYAGRSNAARAGGRLAAVTAVADVTFDVRAGESVGLIGGSGAGKSTVARLGVGLLQPDAGTVRIDGSDLAAARGGERRALRRRLHLLFQDPYTSLPRHMRVADAVAEPLVIHRVGDAGERRARAVEALAEVGLTPAERYAARRADELSGGERQRVALARALVLRPALLIADEPTGMLDASARLELHGLMDDLRRAHGLAYLYITHDLALADGFCDRLVVLHEGRVVEQGDAGAVLGAPASPWTQALVSAAREIQPPPRSGG
jgi:peptide/nickel transport system ATP-binding protein